MFRLNAIRTGRFLTFERIDSLCNVRLGEYDIFTLGGFENVTEPAIHTLQVVGVKLSTMAGGA